jgi:heme exporter protein B
LPPAAILGRLSRHYADGSLNSSYCRPNRLLFSVGVLAHWLVSGLPLALMTPDLRPSTRLRRPPPCSRLCCCWGHPLSLIGAVGCLTLGLRGGSVLISLLVLPLYVPVLIFGAGAVSADTAGLGGQAHLSLLGGCLALAFVLSPLAASAALRIAME